MARIKSEATKWFISITIGIILGMLVGAVSLNALISYRIDDYLEQIQLLKSIIEDKDIRLKKLEESINKRRLIVKEVQINIDGFEDELDKLALQKHIKEKYTQLLGKEAQNIDVDILGEVIDKRLMKVNSKVYRLRVTKIHLMDVLKIWVKVERIE